MLCYQNSKLYRGLHCSLALLLGHFIFLPTYLPVFNLRSSRSLSLLLPEWFFKTINSTTLQCALIPFSASNTPNSFHKCAMLVMVSPFSHSPGSSPTVHLACSLTLEHYAPHQAVNSLWTHQTVSCFYPFSKTFLYLKYTLLLYQHRKLLLVLQKPPTL